MFKAAKIIIFTILISLFGSVFAADTASAFTDLSFSALAVEVMEGESFDIVVSIDPKGIKNYTAKIELNYPPDLLNVSSFKFDRGWISVSQTGYDLVDNSSGVLVKTAGYPGGIADKKSFGTVSFKAKKTGTGNITVSENSLSLGANGKNLITRLFPRIAVAVQKEKSLKPAVCGNNLLESGEECDDRNLNDDDGCSALCRLEICGDGIKQEIEECDDGNIEDRDGCSSLCAIEEICGNGIKEKGEQCDDGNNIDGDGCSSQCKDESLIPEQLFDINSEIDRRRITDIKELTSRVTFFSFGRVPTPIDLIFDILDESGTKVHSEKDDIVVETEAVFTKKFKALNLPPGKYTLALTTLYNVDVEDEFFEKFEIVQIVQIEEKVTSPWIWYGLGALVLILLVVVAGYLTRKKGNKKNDE